MQSPTPTSVAILGILREAKEGHFTPLLRTTLHKLVYLLDVYVAEERGGQTFTGEHWRFLHFGPFAASVAKTMDSLVAERAIFAEAKASEESDAEYVLYNLWRADTPSLRDLVPGGVALRIGADLKKYAKNLPGLLDYVYFRTAPMLEARPGETLHFDKCEKLRVADFKPIAMLPIGKSKLKKTREMLQQIMKRQEAHKPSLRTGPYDEVFVAAIAALDGDEMPVGTAGRARIRTD